VGRSKDGTASATRIAAAAAAADVAAVKSTTHTESALSDDAVRVLVGVRCPGGCPSTVAAVPNTAANTTTATAAKSVVCGVEVQVAKPPFER
jgi:hypothetical protein